MGLEYIIKKANARMELVRKVAGASEEDLKTIYFLFITAPLVKRGHDQHMAIHLLLFHHLMDQSEQSR